MKTQPKLNLLPCLILVVWLAGCVAPNQGGDTRQSEASAVKEHLNSVTIGMSQAEVQDLLGTPTATRKSRDVNGTIEQWMYEESTLEINTLGPGKSMGLAFARGLGDNRNRTYILEFTNGKLTKTSF